MTRNTVNRDTSVHILALGLQEFLPADGDPLEILREIRARGALSVACHPHEMSEFYANTWYLWNRRRTVAGLVDLWEVGCRWELGVQRRARIATGASGDHLDELGRDLGADRLRAPPHHLAQTPHRRASAARRPDSGRAAPS